MPVGLSGWSSSVANARYSSTRCWYVASSTSPFDPGAASGRAPSGAPSRPAVVLLGAAESSPSPLQAASDRGPGHADRPCEELPPVDPHQRVGLAGDPTTVAPAGTSCTTTAPAPTMASSPMVTPGPTIARRPATRCRRS